MKYRRFYLNVSAKRIADGTLRSSKRCPVALELQRQLPKSQVSVGSTWFYVNGKWWRRLPAKILDFIRDFDAEKPVKPFRITFVARSG